MNVVRRALLALDGVKVPDGIKATIWQDGDPLPVDVNEVGFYCGPYREGPDPIIAHLSQLPALQVLQVLSSGVDDLLPHLTPGIRLCNGRGLHDVSTAELTAALVLAAQRDLPGLQVEQSMRRWSRHAPARELAEQTLLIIGHGGVGAAARQRLEGFFRHVLVVASGARPGVHAEGDLMTLVPQADVIVLAVPATTHTYHLVDETFLTAMRSNALLVNVSRGSVVSTTALLQQVQSGRLRAALDVTDPEPLPPDHPLWRTEGVIITPHVGGGGAGALPRARALVQRQLQHWLTGETLENVIVDGGS